MKKVPFNRLSDRNCDQRGCGNRIKQNIVNRKAKDKPLLCYTCYKHSEAKRGHYINL